MLAAVVLGGVGYYVVSEQNSTGRETTALIVNARLGVADARARIESLPIDNPLRRRILTLDKWDRELQNFELSSDRTPQIASRAREIGDQAQRLSDEARAAGAPALTAPVVVAPATPQSVPIEPFGASNTNAQPQTTNAAGAEPRNEAVKPPITAAPPTVPPVEGVASPPAVGAGTATPTATPTTTPTTTPPATAPPTRPTTRMPPPPPPPPVEETKKPVP